MSSGSLLILHVCSAKALRIWVSPFNVSYFLHFFDVLLLQSLQKLAFSLTSILAVLQASSLLPLDPPSHSSVVLSYPNMLLMRPNLRFYMLTHVHISMCQTYWVHAHAWSVVRVVLQTLVALVQNVLPICQSFTHFTLSLSISCSPPFHPSLWGHEHECAYRIKASGKWDDTDHK